MVKSVARLAPLAMLLVLGISLLSATVAAHAARYAGPTILVDLAHGENVRGLCTLFAIVPEAHWVVLVPSEDYKLPECPVKPAEILVGDFAKVADKLKDFDMIIIGQPTRYLSQQEIEVLKQWFHSIPGRVLWCAGDSDYPAQGGNQEIANHACDALLAAIGSKLRLDFVSVEDTVSNAGRPYRVVGVVKPDPRYGAEVIAYGASKVLFHGPGAVVWVDAAGKWHKLTESNAPKNIVKIVVTSENGRIVEHQPRQPGAPGEFGKAHRVGEQGVFVLMAAEVIETGKQLPNIVIVSGESPYGGYQPMVTYRYHGVPLSGPRFVRNVILWALQYPAELGIASKIEETVSSKLVSAVAEEATKSILALESKVDSLTKEVSNLIESMNSLSAGLGSIAAAAYASIGLAVAAIVVAAAAIALARKK